MKKHKLNVSGITRGNHSAWFSHGGQCCGPPYVANRDACEKNLQRKVRNVLILHQEETALYPLANISTS